MSEDQEWLEEKFWPKVDTSGDCWIWTAGTSTRGYGIVIYNGRKERAHRVLKAITDGVDISEIPRALLACHKCDNRLCVKPSHIFWGTNADNMQDAMIKGRLVRTPGQKKNWTSKVTIKELQVKVDELQKELAEYKGCL